MSFGQGRACLTSQTGQQSEDTAVYDECQPVSSTVCNTASSQVLSRAQSIGNAAPWNLPYSQEPERSLRDGLYKQHLSYCLVGAATLPKGSSSDCLINILPGWVFELEFLSSVDGKPGRFSVCLHQETVFTLSNSKTKSAWWMTLEWDGCLVSMAQSAVCG